MISIIVPIYNAEKTIGRCIESVLFQNIKQPEYELILIDDGSMDRTAEICKKYVCKNNNIFYFYQKNQGASAARNQGIQESKGEYIIFLDADDVLEHDFLSLAFEKITTNSDLYIFNIKAEYQIDDFDNSIITSLQDKVRLINSICGLKEYSNIKMPQIAGPVAKIYARNLLNRLDIKFDERIVFAEDMLFNIYAILGADQIECINKIVYQYIQNPLSLMNSYYTTNLMHDEYFLVEFKKISEKYSELQKAYEYSFVNSFAVLFRRDFGNRNNCKTYRQISCDFKKLLTDVRPYSEENYRQIYQRRKKLFGLKKRIIIWLLINHNIYLMLLICRTSRFSKDIVHIMKQTLKIN